MEIKLKKIALKTGGFSAWLVVATFLLMLAFSGSVKAGDVVLFDNLGTADIYDNNPLDSWYMYSNGFSNSIDGLQYAVRFTPSQTALLSYIEIPVDIFNDGGNVISMSLTSDGGTQPGTPILTESVGGLSVGSYYDSAATFALFEPPSYIPITLTASQNYWLNVSVQASSYTSARWYSSSFDNSSPTVATTFATYGTWTSQNAGRDIPALEVVGYVPEPTAIATLLPTTGLLIARRRKR
jgi:hypothetical protein